MKNYKLKNLEMALKIEDNRSQIFGLANILDVTWDTAKNKLRGKSEIKLSEAIKICEHFNTTLELMFKADHDVFLRRFVRNSDTKAS